MRNLYVLIRREMMAYFLGPTGYLCLTGFMLVQGMLFHQLLGFARDPTASIGGNLYTIYFSGFPLFLFLMVMVPAVTMRLFAEEKRSGTLETLMTAPVSDVEVVLAKYGSALLFYGFLWAMTLSHMGIYINHMVQGPLSIFGWRPPYGFLGALLLWGTIASAVWTVASLSDRDAVRGTLAVGALALCLALLYLYIAKTPEQMPDLGKIACGYLGSLLIGGTLLALGLLLSSLTQNQVTAAILTASALVMYFFIGAFGPQIQAKVPFTDAKWGEFFTYVSLMSRSDEFSNGQLQMRSVALFLSATAFFLFGTVKAVEVRKWR